MKELDFDNALTIERPSYDVLKKYAKKNML